MVEQFLEIIADELNVKQVILGEFTTTELDNSEGKLRAVYYHDTMKGGGELVAEKNGKRINAPKFLNIMTERFLANVAN